MIVMHYRFTLPADYDMAIIKERIRQNGSRLDGFPGLVAKAFLYRCRNEGGLPENRYAPLYFWRDATAMQRFLQSPGFATLVNDFGWPIIESWLASEGHSAVSHLADAQFLTLKRWTIAPHSSLAALTHPAGFCAWDISRWQGVEVTASVEPPPAGQRQETYHIGYLARGAAASEMPL